MLKGNSKRTSSNSLRDLQKLPSRRYQPGLWAVYMIPEWLSFRNEFRPRVKFVLHSHVKIERLSLRRSGSCGFRAIIRYPFATRPRLQDLRFSISERSFTRMKFLTLTERLVREQMFVSVSCEHYANKYMEVEWTHPGMEVIPASIM